MSDKEIFEEEGWTIECESPFEIRHIDGSFATLNAANIVYIEIVLNHKLQKRAIASDIQGYVHKQ
jgi:hypothetical protein